jgi:hypothetical protein
MNIRNMFGLNGKERLGNEHFSPTQCLSPQISHKNIKKKIDITTEDTYKQYSKAIFQRSHGSIYSCKSFKQSCFNAKIAAEREKHNLSKIKKLTVKDLS